MWEWMCGWGGWWRCVCLPPVYCTCPVYSLSHEQLQWMQKSCCGRTVFRAPLLPDDWVLSPTRCSRWWSGSRGRERRRRRQAQGGEQALRKPYMCIGISGMTKFLTVKFQYMTCALACFVWLCTFWCVEYRAVRAFINCIQTVIY